MTSLDATAHEIIDTWSNGAQCGNAAFPACDCIAERDPLGVSPLEAPSRCNVDTATHI